MNGTAWDRLLNLWERLKNSLWFVPVVMTVTAGLFAFVALRLDAGLAGRERVWWLHSGKAESASDLLSTLLSSIITMTTLAISITMVVLTLAASQLGPRLIRSFIGNRRTQVALGIFVMTIVYLLLVYRRVDDHLDREDVPHVAITIGSALALACVFVLLLYVHHLARSIVADTVIARVGGELDGTLGRLLPEPAPGGPEDERAAAGEPPPVGEPLHLPGGGYVQAILYEKLTRCAAEAGVVVQLDFRAGHHLLPGGRHGRVRPPERLTPELVAAIAGCVVVGSERTPTQDLEFSIRQLEEVALRALSPSVNDPFTAIAVIDRLAMSLALAMGRDMAPLFHRDAAGTIRVIGRPATFTGLVDEAFDQIRQAAAGNAAVLIRLLEVVAELACHLRTAEQREALGRHAAMIASAGRRGIEEEHDLAALDRRHTAAVRALGAAPLAEPARSP
ncbi:MAG TPA: DUF2254 domain-containing protein [Geminicoccaceae bacterium]|nr:DUF2254 domain-containing protein [Geminicoccaceae bacterium]